jgi:hypothetical protein
MNLKFALTLSFAAIFMQLISSALCHPVLEESSNSGDHVQPELSNLALEALQHLESNMGLVAKILYARINLKLLSLILIYATGIFRSA